MSCKLHCCNFLYLFIQAPYDEIDRKLQDASAIISQKGTSTSFALIIDGNALTHALTSSLKNSFLDLAVNCASVLCCRISPKQKALVSNNHKILHLFDYFLSSHMCLILSRTESTGL
jgi:magnesium-transporting ATPase (P-type)